MSKHHQQNKSQSKNRVGNSGEQEKPEQVQEKMGSSKSGSVSSPSYEDIQRRAYEIHEQKGGSDMENWLEAERSFKENR